MQKPSSPQDKWRNIVLPFTTLVVLFADQLSKTWITSNLAVGQSLFEVGFFRITRIHNTGAAFGLFPGQSFLLTIVGLVGVVLLLVCAFLIHRRFFLLDNMLSKVAIGLLLGGAVGNLIDRLRFGYVIDFISVGIWPTFNIADSAVVVGVIIFAYSLRSLARAREG